MKKYLLTFIAAILVSFSAMAFNNTLKEAYEILQTAKTADDYSRAEKKFRSASAPQFLLPQNSFPLLRMTFSPSCVITSQLKCHLLK